MISSLGLQNSNFKKGMNQKGDYLYLSFYSLEGKCDRNCHIQIVSYWLWPSSVYKKIYCKNTYITLLHNVRKQTFTLKSIITNNGTE